MKVNRLIVVFAALLFAFACKNDDNGDEVISVPPQTLAETAVENDAAIQEFLQTHFYNYDEFENPPADFDFKIEFGLIEGDNSDKRPLVEFIQTETILVASSAFGLDDGEEVDHKLYFLVAREGVGESPTVGDNTVLGYEGSLIDGTLFDGSSSPRNQYLPGFLRGFSNGIVKLKAGIGPVENGDGTVSFTDYGIGAVFMPSGLAYFNVPRTSIPAYSPLIFKLDMFSFEKDTDFDGDGIPSILEDLDGDGDLNNDNTDADSEPPGVFLPNHNDSDDDDDGIPTIDEIELDEDGNFVGFKDTDGDGISDHLDNDN